MFWTAFLPLFLAGLVGIAVFALAAPQQLLDKIPIQSELRKRLLVVLQPTALLLILAAAGAGVAETVGSQSLLVDARGDPLQDGWSVPVLSFFAVGLFAGALLYVGDRWARPAWASEGDADLISQ